MPAFNHCWTNSRYQQRVSPPKQGSLGLNLVKKEATTDNSLNTNNGGVSKLIASERIE